MARVEIHLTTGEVKAFLTPEAGLRTQVKDGILTGHGFSMEMQTLKAALIFSAQGGFHSPA